MSNMKHSGQYFKLPSCFIASFILGMVFFSVPSFALQGSEKTGVVDIGKILRLMPEMKKAEATLQAETVPVQKQLDRMNLELKNAIALYEQQKQSLSPAVRSQKESELKQKIQALQNYRKTNADVLEKRKQTLFSGIRLKLMNVVQSIAQQEDFSVVLDKAASLYAKPDHDLTLKVMKQLNIQ
jgi:outer membrane protein